MVLKLSRLLIDRFQRRQPEELSALVMRARNERSEPPGFRAEAKSLWS